MDIYEITADFTAGIITGAAYFYGLWFTVKKLPAAKRKGMLLIGSFIFRMALVIAVFCVVTPGRWQNLAACLAGFMIVRSASMRRVKSLLQRTD